MLFAGPLNLPWALVALPRLMGPCMRNRIMPKIHEAPRKFHGSSVQEKSITRYWMTHDVRVGTKVQLRVDVRRKAKTKRML